MALVDRERMRDATKPPKGDEPEQLDLLEHLASLEGTA